MQVFNRIRLDRIVCTHCLALLHANKASSGASPFLDADGYASSLTMCASVSESFISLNFVYKPFALMLSCNHMSLLMWVCSWDSPYESPYDSPIIWRYGLIEPPDLWQVCITNCKRLLLIESRCSVPERAALKSFFKGLFSSADLKSNHLTRLPSLMTIMAMNSFWIYSNWSNLFRQLQLLIQCFDERRFPWTIYWVESTL